MSEQDLVFNKDAFLKNLTTQPGVYQMLNAQGDVLYVGKARNLKNRVSSYFRQTAVDAKTQALVGQVHHIKVVITNSENEALLLESNLIKKLQPRYNVLLRDDKSYPYLLLTEHKDFPRLEACRGRNRKSGRFFGPYLNAATVYETLQLLQKLFKLRQCQDSFFHNRKRPCLQYQIKRCSAPCVNLISSTDYLDNVRSAVLFLEGKSQQVIADLIKRMDAAVADLQFEQAANYRDQIARLRSMQEQQSVMRAGIKHDADIFAITQAGVVVCIHMLMIRAGQLLGSRTYFPQIPSVMEVGEVLAAFIAQFYLATQQDRSIPPRIYISHALPEQSWLEQACMEKAQHKVRLCVPKKGIQKNWLVIALKNAQHALTSHLASKNQQLIRLQALQEALKLIDLPERIECFDISHSQGEATIASCVVFDQRGPLTSAYRRFNIRGVSAGDDYAAIHQALTRHFTHLKTSNQKMPEIVLIDGGKGQLQKAIEVFSELQIDQVTLIGIAKGITRKPGLETLWIAREQGIQMLEVNVMALHLLQQIRDEAHRFAITGHRRKRDKTRLASRLEEISGVGAKRRRELLRYFGGLQEIKRASAVEISKVPGISQNLAERIYTALHGT
jgi:excinuclease ABC subunit C